MKKRLEEHSSNRKEDIASWFRKISHIQSAIGKRIYNIFTF